MAFRSGGGATADVAALVAAARDGQTRAIARLISLVEDESPRLREVAAALAPHTGGAMVLGLTGSPGVGKSTTTSALMRAFRERGMRVGVLAIDPSSPFSGGALLGDRIRMHEHASDRGVFIRSMSSRGHLGGLSWACPQALRVLDASGFDVVLIETVGVGQAEVEIASMADTTLVVMAPGLGDGIQAAKAGILEIADIFVVNKADRDGAQAVVRDLRTITGMSAPESQHRWRPPILRTVAQRSEGIDDVIEAIDAHHRWLREAGELHRRRLARARGEVVAIAMESVRGRLRAVRGHVSLSALSEDVLAGRCDPYSAADTLLADLPDRR